MLLHLLLVLRDSFLRFHFYTTRRTMDDENDLELLHDACESGDLNMVAAMHEDPEGPNLNE